MATTPVTDRVGYLVKQVQHGLRARMDQSLRSLGISTAQYAVMAALDEAPGASGAELARRCFITPQTVTALIATLAAEAIVEREPSPTHGRIIETRLSTSGRSLLRRAHKLVAEVEGELLADLSGAERERLAALLQRCVLRLGRPPV